MRIAITGASGLVGWPVAQWLAARGHTITTIGRRQVPGLAHRDWHLGQVPDLSGQDALVHAAFTHVPGRYRGGEGDDPEGFTRANLGGTLSLMDAAEAARLRIVFLSSRAVYGAYPPGTRLTEELPPRPDTLYGEVKLAAERALGRRGTSLRATGIYGPLVPGRGHKWADLFARFAAGDRPAPRIGTELHVDDLADAIERVLAVDTPPPVVNVSDIVLDRRDLLERYARIAGIPDPLPHRGDPDGVSEMDTARLRDLGWRPRGVDGLDTVLEAIVAARD
ncbi:Nucleoside-diphosphate-sugar epimerase [Palleronia marisminoris]|uniref:UDP-glucose 4-epimerase n=1 Tax=Palleronia marisminoris TaxID=315423 RepID=A0A1Y5TT58_9RHOB|nr:NAD(P)-dependent oxidoreductase [Palleronia marisminoris]SFH44444.1 Nucleoside-diphosphate-sugar epimerase [Palleronia marisminoris]SLN67477.1 UDP-glucose 4-epimerase [Palleronia marisminoris]